MVHFTSEHAFLFWCFHLTCFESLSFTALLTETSVMPQRPLHNNIYRSLNSFSSHRTIRHYSSVSSRFMNPFLQQSHATCSRQKCLLTNGILKRFPRLCLLFIIMLRLIKIWYNNTWAGLWKLKGKRNPDETGDKNLKHTVVLVSNLSQANESLMNINDI